MHLLHYLVDEEPFEVEEDERGKFYIIGAKWYKWGKDNKYI